MAKLIRFVCLLLVGCHSISAASFWAPSDQSSGQVYLNSDAQDSVANSVISPEHYYSTGTANLQQPAITTNVEPIPTNQPVVSEHKAHESGTKGGGLFQGFFRKKQQPLPQQPLLLQGVPEAQAQPFLNSGYLETVPTTQVANVTLANQETPKYRLRNLLPWNWIYITPSPSTVAESISPIQVIQPEAPKRSSWSIWPSQRQTPPTPCQCQWPTYTFPVASYQPLPAPIGLGTGVSSQPSLPGIYGDVHETDSSTGSNVNVVTPSGDHTGLGSNVIERKILPPPQLANNVPSESTVQQNQASALPSGTVPTLGSAGESGSTNVQQVVSQQVPFTFPGNAFSGNANSPPIAAPNTFQPSGGVVSQSSQTHATN